METHSIVPSPHPDPTTRRGTKCFVPGLILLALGTCIAPGMSATTPPDGARVETDRVALRLTHRGSIRSLIDRTTGRELLTGTADIPLFRFQISRETDSPSPLIQCHAGQADTVRIGPHPRGAEHGVQITFSGFGGRPIEFTCTIVGRTEDGQARFSLDTTLPPGVTLESVTYPIVEISAAAAPGPPGRVAVAGATKGGLQRPGTWKRGESRRFDQPGNLAAGFGCCYDAAGGVHTAALDSAAHPKSLWFGRTTTGIEMGWVHPCYARTRFGLGYDVTLTAFSAPDAARRPADWRDSADLYKRWATRQPWCARTFAQRTDLPDWLRQGAPMVRFTRAWLAEPASIESWLRDYWRKEFPESAPLIVAYWGWEKVGKWVGPDYFPAYPSDARFGELVRFGRALGAHAFLWPSGYHFSLSYGKRPGDTFLWDNRDAFESVAAPHAIVGRDRRALVRDCAWLRGGAHCPMCPGDPWTIDWLNRAALECVRRGADLIQVDQVVGGRFPPCYSRAHGHPPGPGAWAPAAFRTQLQTMTRACRAVDPGTIVGFEEPNEWFLQDAGIQDYRDCDIHWAGGEPASVFAYLYHEYLPTLFQSNRAQTGHDPWALAWCIVHGQIPHLAPRIGLGRGPMIVDGGFERSSDEGSIEFPRTMLYPGERWSGGETEIDRVNPHSGAACLKLHNPTGTGRALASQNYDVTEEFRPGKKYRLSLWLRTRQITTPNAAALTAFAPGMRALESWEIPYPTEQPDWTRAQVEFALPEGASALRVSLALAGPGAVWLDDLRIDEVLADGRMVPVQRPAHPADHDLMRRWIDLYHGEGRPWLLLGKMLHPPRLEIEGAPPDDACVLPPVLHNAFEAPDGTRALIVANGSTRAWTIAFAWGGRSHRITLGPAEVRLLR